MIFFITLMFVSFSALASPITVGSKKFTENVILGEMAAHLVREQGLDVTHKREMGGTRVLWNALQRGDIDMYFDYTGTLFQEIFAKDNLRSMSDLKAKMASLNLAISDPLGFNNTYALALTKNEADKLGIEKISDLNNHPKLRLAFPNEFIDRKDGLENLRKKYNLVHRNVRGMDHDLAFRGLESKSVDVIAVYSTDAEIDYYNLKVLQDDRHAFPEYKAVLVYRSELDEHIQGWPAILGKLEGVISESKMIDMNSAAKIRGVSEVVVAHEFLNGGHGTGQSIVVATMWERIAHDTRIHLLLVTLSLIAATLIGVPLGILCANFYRVGQIILAVVGVVQTIPSLALLVLMIPLFGIGERPVIFALFLYSLLPIVRNTFTGLVHIPTNLIETSEAMGLTRFQRLRFVELPLASPSILSGIKTSAVLNVGFATIGALVGAGGYGQPILTGIRLDNFGLILQGAIPAAILALLMQGFFEGIDRWVVPKGLKVW